MPRARVRGGDVADDARAGRRLPAVWLVDPDEAPSAERGGASRAPEPRATDGALVEAVLEAGRASGGRVVYLEVRAGNVGRAPPLHSDSASATSASGRGYYGPGQDAIVMELRLGERA